MYSLKFDEDVCATCTTSDCLVKCQYIDVDREMAHKEVMKIVGGEGSFVLRDCVTCYSCEEYCKRGNHLCYLISERREEKGILHASRPITDQYIRINEPRGKYKTGDIRETALSFCYGYDFQKHATGKLFDGIASSYVYGAEFFCQAAYLHFGKSSVIKNRLPGVIEKIHQLGVKKLICLHDECYGSFTSLAKAYEMEVPFEPSHYLEYLFGRLIELKGEIKPLHIRAAFQRPCSSRLSPDKYVFVKDILDLIGVELAERKYQEENALCCGELLRSIGRYELANDIQERNIEDMVESKAEYCVFNCPYCQLALSDKVARKGIRPLHIIDACKIALGEKKIAEVN